MVGTAEGNAIASFSLKLNRRMTEERGEDRRGRPRQREIGTRGRGDGDGERGARLSNRLGRHSGVRRRLIHVHRAAMRSTAPAAGGQVGCRVQQYARRNQREADRCQKGERWYTAHRSMLQQAHLHWQERPPVQTRPMRSKSESEASHDLR